MANSAGDGAQPPEGQQGPAAGPQDPAPGQQGPVPGQQGPAPSQQGPGPGQEGPAPGPQDPGAGPDPPGRLRAGPQHGDPLHELIHLARQYAIGAPLTPRLPGWRRKTKGEPRWPVSGSVLAAIALQLLLPDRLNEPLPHFLLPVLEGCLLAGLAIANPIRIERGGRAVRAASIALILLMTAANAVSAVLLVRAIIEGLPGTSTAGPLLTSGASVWATNVIAFALWYWEFDSGGPLARYAGAVRYPDFMFAQMASPELAAPDWKPYFADYLYLSFTNATAFSPTDVMPMARWAKLTMLVQSGVSLAVGALVIARAVNILK